MSKPTPREELYRWHTEAIEDVSLHLDITAHPDDPQCGWYKRKLVKDGVYVPCRIWRDEPEVDENGDLVSDEKLMCEVDGDRKDAAEQWQWLCAHPISEAEFNYLTETRAWADRHAPADPYANPKKPVDWLNGVPTPTFTKERT